MVSCQFRATPLVIILNKATCLNLVIFSTLIRLMVWYYKTLRILNMLRQLQGIKEIDIIF